MGSKLDIEEKLVRRLAEILDETGLTEIEVEEAGRRVKVARNAAPTTLPPPHPIAALSPVEPEPVERGPATGTVTSPMVGTVYVAPDPGAAPFVKVGDQVNEGQTLMIIEAMKVMNNLPSPHAGRVVEVLVRDGQPVEFGEALVVVQ